MTQCALFIFITAIPVLRFVAYCNYRRQNIINNTSLDWVTKLNSRFLSYPQFPLNITTALLLQNTPGFFTLSSQTKYLMARLPDK